MPPAPSFDTWPAAFLFGAVQGFFIAFVLWRMRRGVATANRLLSVLLFLFSLALIEYVCYWTRYTFYAPYIADISLHFPFLFGPLVYLYLRSVYENKGLSRRDLWHLLPFALAILAFGKWYLTGAEGRQAFLLQKARYPVHRYIIWFFTWARVVHLMAYAVWNALYIRRAAIVAPWTVRVNAFYTGFALAYISYFVLVRFPFFSPAWDYHISLVMTIFIYMIAYAAYAHPLVFDGVQWSEPETPVKYRNSGLTAEASRSLLHKMVVLMEEEKLYRDPDLNLEGLSKRMDAGKHHVSQVINENMGMSFFEYINQLRIEEAKRLLEEKSRSDLHVIEAAYAVGFNNKVSFNAAFKKATGMTPTEYRKKRSKSDPSGAEPGVAQKGGA